MTAPIPAPLLALLRHDGQVPRYTSYPPAPYFNRNPESIDALGLVDESNSVGPWNASFYVHIPFCPKRCHFCGCHTEVGAGHEAIRAYLETMLAEADLLLPHIDARRPVTQIHFGGGTPNAVPFAFLADLLGAIRSKRAIEPDAEVAIECDPNFISEDRLRELGEMGFNRVSFGIQDFDPKVLYAVNRRFPKTAPKELFRVARELGFRGNNLDLIYGLPHQTPESFRDTIERALDASPDRISLFPYAHVPWIKGHQSVLDSLPMPDAPTRLAIAWESRESLLQAGYVAIGMDHFARAGDELALAVRDGHLHRNFQGYCTSNRAGQVYALGASGISQLHGGYLQNHKDLAQYSEHIRSGRLPWSGGYRMRPEDLAVRSVINGILCAGRADLGAAFAEAEVPTTWRLPYLSGCLERLRPYLDDGLVSLHDGDVRLVGDGIHAARLVAAAFDPLLATKSEGAEAPRYSKAI